MVLIIATLTTSVAEARITDADIDRINAEARANLLRTMPNALNPEVAQADIEKKWQLYNQPPREDANNSNRKYQTYSAQCVNFGRTDTVLKPIAGYTCALTKTAGNFKGWMEKTEVVQRGGYWRMIIDCGKADVYGSAICWNN